ncbi:Ig 2 domain containing protein [Trichuris trichiura]|uniref:Ig 2 domain containing protein n=1 Tax=Trichuris trichiura TaxID=36087 RepID=A0A077ZA49_TRITR|nr:Ig 2 domain containing protein [Trichuris trichiura]
MRIEKLWCNLLYHVTSLSIIIIGVAFCENLLYRGKPKARPYFDPTMSTEVTALAMEPAYLHCIVHNLGTAEYLVKMSLAPGLSGNPPSSFELSSSQLVIRTAWIRQSDRQIISVQDVTVTSDYRFQISHRKHSNDWCLIIKHATANDTGAYECLLSTDPPLRFVKYLHVVENNVSISGSPVVKDGDTIVVRCAITLLTPTGILPSSILWYINDTLIPSTKNIKYHHYVTVSKKSIISELRVRAATITDSGVYSCRCENAPVREMYVAVKGNKHVRRFELIKYSREWTYRACKTDCFLSELRYIMQMQGIHWHNDLFVAHFVEVNK